MGGDAGREPFALGPHGSLADPCVICGHAPVARILYGMPAGPPEGDEEGYVVLGGCTLFGDDPTHRCTRCGTEYWQDGRVAHAEEGAPTVAAPEDPWIVDPDGAPGGPTANLLFEHTPGWPDTSDRSLVYGSTDDAPELLWFVPERAAGQLIGVGDALWSAPTWGELRARVWEIGPETFASVLGWFDDEAPGDDDPFEREQFPGVADGDFPPHIGLLVPEWAPPPVVHRHGVRFDTTFNGSYIAFPASDEDVLVSTLVEAGFACRRDDTVIRSLDPGDWYQEDADRTPDDADTTSSATLGPEMTEVERRATALQSSARDLALRSEYDAANAVFRELIELCRSQGATWGMAVTLADVAQLFVDLGRRTEAARMAIDAAEVFLALGAPVGALDALKPLADALSDAGDHNGAEALYGVLRDDAGSRGDRSAIATLDMELGTVAARRGQLDQARALYRQALTGFAAEDTVDRARCLQNLGPVLRELGEPDAAAQTLEEARGLFEAAGMRREVADTDVNLANLWWQEGRVAEAEALLGTARTTYLALGLPVEAADCTDTLGALRTTEGHPAAALELHGNASAVYREHGEELEDATCAYNWAHALLHLGRLEDALAHLAGARPVLLAAGADSALAEHVLLEASVRSALGEHEHAGRLVADARAIVDRIQGGPDLIVACDVTLGETLHRAGALEQAVAVLEDALARADRFCGPLTAADAAEQLARTQYVLGDEAAPASAHQRFEALGLHRRAAHVLTEPF